MASQYRTILSKPGALSFSAAGLVARFPMSMMGISTILAVESTYGSYAAAGRVSGVGVVATAIGAPILARAVDRHGQARVMLPAIILSACALIAGIIAVDLHAPEPVLMIAATVAGGLSGSMGSLVRSRWTTVLTNAADIHTAFSLEAALDEVAFIIGPVLATALCTAPFLPVTSGWILCVTLQLGGGLWFLSQRASEPPVLPRHDVDNMPATRPRLVVSYGAVAATVGVFLASGAMFGANDVAVVAFSQEQHQPSMAGVVLAAWGIGSLIAALVYGSRTWRWPLSRQLVIAVAVLAAGSTLFPFAPTLWWLCVAMIGAGMAIAPMVTCGNNIVQATVPPHQLTEGLTFLSTALNLGVSVGSMVAGMVVDSHASFGGFIVVSACAWASFAVCVVTYRLIRRA